MNVGAKVTLRGDGFTTLPGPDEFTTQLANGHVVIGVTTHTAAQDVEGVASW